MPIVRTEDLQAFISVVDTGSLTAAAQALGLPKSTVSRRLARLESDLGAALVMRTSRSTQITELGQLLHRQGAPALANLDELQRVLADRAAEPSGPLRVSAPPDLAAVHLGPLCAAFLGAHPQVRLTVVATSEFTNVISDGFDVALRAHVDPLPSVTSLRARRLARMDVRLYAAPGYLDAHGRPRRPSELRAHRCLSIAVFARAWPLSNSRSGRHEQVSLEPALNGNDHLLVRDAALAGAGIAVLPSFLGDLHVGEGRLERVLPGWCIQSADLSAVWPATHHTSPRVRAFVDAAVAFFDPPPWSRRPWSRG